MSEDKEQCSPLMCLRWEQVRDNLSYDTKRKIKHELLITGAKICKINQRLRDKKRTKLANKMMSELLEAYFAKTQFDWIQSAVISKMIKYRSNKIGCSE